MVYKSRYARRNLEDMNRRMQDWKDPDRKDGDFSSLAGYYALPWHSMSRGPVLWNSLHRGVRAVGDSLLATANAR